MRLWAVCIILIQNTLKNLEGVALWMFLKIQRNGYFVLKMNHYLSPRFRLPMTSITVAINLVTPRILASFFFKAKAVPFYVSILGSIIHLKRRNRSKLEEVGMMETWIGTTLKTWESEFDAAIEKKGDHIWLLPRTMVLSLRLGQWFTQSPSSILVLHGGNQNEC